MNSLQQIIESSPSVRHLAISPTAQNDQPSALREARWNWAKIQRVLVVRLRSIGDTVLTTPSLFALRRFLPNAQIDMLLEDWVAPVFDGLDLINQVITVPRGSNTARARIARETA